MKATPVFEAGANYLLSLCVEVTYFLRLTPYRLEAGTMNPWPAQTSPLYSVLGLIGVAGTLGWFTSRTARS